MFSHTLLFPHLKRYFLENTFVLFQKGWDLWKSMVMAHTVMQEYFPNSTMGCYIRLINNIIAFLIHPLGFAISMRN